MRFLVMTCQGSVQPPPEALPLILPACKDWIHDRVKAGKLEAVFSYAEGGGGCGIARCQLIGKERMDNVNRAKKAPERRAKSNEDLSEHRFV